jgi:hypothetical protein
LMIETVNSLSQSLVDGRVLIVRLDVIYPDNMKK